MKTKLNRTKTSEGIIPHLKYKGLDCPVILRVDRRGKLLLDGTGSHALPVPLRILGKLAYALPGGTLTLGE